MKSYKIIPNSGQPYTNIKFKVSHKESDKPTEGRRGEVVLNVLHNNGTYIDLSFHKHEIEEVK